MLALKGGADAQAAEEEEEVDRDPARGRRGETGGEADDQDDDDNGPAGAGGGLPAASLPYDKIGDGTLCLASFSGSGRVPLPGLALR